MFNLTDELNKRVKEMRAIEPKGKGSYFGEFIATSSIERYVMQNCCYARDIEEANKKLGIGNSQARQAFQLDNAGLAII